MKYLSFILVILFSPCVLAQGMNGMANNITLGGTGAALNLGTSVSATNPRITGSPTNGFYTPAAAEVAVAISGVQIINVTASTLNANKGITESIATTASSGSTTFNSWFFVATPSGASTGTYNG